MRKSMQELIERASDIKVYYALDSYELHQYEDGSFIDFKILKVVDLVPLMILAGGLQLSFFADGDYMIVRLFERYEESL